MRMRRPSLHRPRPAPCRRSRFTRRCAAQAGAVLSPGRQLGEEDTGGAGHGSAAAGRGGDVRAERASRRARWTSPIRSASSARCWARCRPSARRPTGSSSTRATSSPSSATRRGWIPTYSVAKSMMATVAGIARARGQDHPRRRRSARRSRTAATIRRSNAQVTWKMHLQQETEWEGTCSARSDDFVGKEAFGEGERKPRELQRARHPLRVQRRPHQPPGAVAPAHVQEAGARSVPRRDHGRDRRLERVEVGAVPQQLRRHRRQEAALGERRHALGRRRVDQLVGHGALRLPVAARRQVGREAAAAARLREGGHSRRARTGPTTATCGG